LPTHPDLLDYLADRYIRLGWDTKALLKEMVLSATYQQSSEGSAKLYEEDPRNSWLARGPRNRLPAEMIRDAALFSSGLLVEQLGGPPVKPYQPPGLWEEKGSESYQRDEGPGSHRRSLYTYWKRTSPPPAMMTFDAADREVCVVERQTTATPLQALVLLNDPQFVEAARAAAQEVSKTAIPVDERINQLFREFTGRHASEAERAVLIELYAEQRLVFAKSSRAVDEFLSAGDHQRSREVGGAELAAMTIVAQAIMNHYDTVTKP
jgi:hypothetical protein